MKEYLCTPLDAKRTPFIVSAISDDQAGGIAQHESGISAEDFYIEEIEHQTEGATA